MHFEKQKCTFNDNKYAALHAGARTKEEEEAQPADEYEVPPVREEPVTKHQKATEEEALRRAGAIGNLLIIWWLSKEKT